MTGWQLLEEELRLVRFQRDSLAKILVMLLEKGPRNFIDAATEIQIRELFSKIMTPPSESLPS